MKGQIEDPSEDFSTWIKTISNDNIVLQKENRLKGLGLQCFVSHLVKQKYDAKELAGDEDTVNSINDKAKNVLNDLFSTKSTFRIIGDKGKSKTFYPKNSNHFNYDNYLIDLSDFNEPYTLKEKVGMKNSTLGYVGCSNCYYAVPKKFCKICGGAILEDKQVLEKIKNIYKTKNAAELFFERYPDKVIYNDDPKQKFLFNIKWIKELPWNEGVINIDAGSWSNKAFCEANSHDSVPETHSHSDNGVCPKCGMSFKEIRPGLSSKQFDSVGKNLSKKQIKQNLKENNFINKSSSSFSKSRLDSWLISEDSNEIFIIETKNYEDTALSFKDFMQIMRYLKAIRNKGFAKTKQADIIYNGSASDNIQKSIDKFSQSIETDLNVVRIKEICHDVGLYPKQIVVSKDLKSPDAVLGEFKVSWDLTDEFVENPKLRIKTETEVSV